MTFKLIILIVTISISLIKSLDLIYLFQIKEYRFDRFWSMINDEGFLSVFYLRKIRLPAVKLRNFLIEIVFVILGSFLICLLSTTSILLIIFNLVLFPIIAFIGIAVGVITTSIPVCFYRKRLMDKAKNLLKNHPVKIIGITGSSGKTTTKEFLYQILSHKYKVAKTEGNMNTDIGVAMSIINNLKKDTQYFIVEMGAYKKGEIKTICDLVNPRLGIITNIGNQHLDLFGTKKNLIDSKKELLIALPVNSQAYINVDLEEYKQLVFGIKSRIVAFSAEKNADIFLNNVSLAQDKTSGNIVYKNKTISFQTKIIGKHTLINLLPVVGLSLDLGIKPNELTTYISELKPVAQRLVVKKGLGNSLVVDDSYNSNVDGFLDAIEISSRHSHKNKIIISRGIIELGTEKTSSYQKILTELNRYKIPLLTTDKLFKQLDKNNLVTLFDNEQQLVDKLIKIINKDTLLIIEGKFPKYILDKLYDLN